MARPRVFVSSTFYDLRHIRASIERFISSLGYEAVLSERGDVAYAFDVPLDESCYREVENCTIYVLIVGGRYGSESSRSRDSRGVETLPTSVEQYESITKRECTTAQEQGIPIYILVERGVLAEYETYQRNRDNPNIQWVHVDSPNVFRFIEDLKKQRLNNPIHAFERAIEIEDWLREQWAGLLSGLLRRRVNESHIATLEQQVKRVAETNDTLKTYLELTIKNLNIQEAAATIAEEARRLQVVRARIEFSNLDLVRHLRDNHWMAEECIFAEFRGAESFADFRHRVQTHLTRNEMTSCGRVQKGNEDVDSFERLRLPLQLNPWPPGAPHQGPLEGKATAPN